MSQPTTTTTLGDAERAERDARKALKAAEQYLASAIRDAVALSFKRDEAGVERYDEADLRNIGRLAIKANLAKAILAHRRIATQAALLAQPANPSA